MLSFALASLLRSSSLLAPGLAAIFDVDGVIVDSNPLHVESWGAYLGRFGLPFGEETQRRMYGQHNFGLVKMLFGDHLSDEETRAHGAAKEALYREMLAGRLDALLVPGLKALLDALDGSPLAVASNAEPGNVDFVLSRAGVRGRFQTVLDGSMVARPKPFPDIYLLAAERLGVAPADCIVFEDSYSGVEAACAAGMRVVGLTTTHAELPGTSLAVPDFREPKLHEWLARQRPAASRE